MSVKKYTENEMAEMTKKAQTALKTMTVAGVGIGFAPVMVDIAALMTAMGAGVVAIGKCYGFNLDKQGAGDLIKQFFKAAGTTYAFVFAGQKIAASFLKSNPVSYIPAMISDAVMCGAIAYAVGSTSEKYFRRKAEGSKATADDIKRWMEEGKREGKAVSKKHAEEQAARMQDSK